MRIRTLHFAVSVLACRLPAARSPANAPGDCTHAGTGEDHARRRDSDGAGAQPHAAGRAHHDPAERGAGNHGEPAPESRAAGRRAVSAALSTGPVRARTTSNNAAQFDLGVSYLFERGKKRQHRLAAAKDQTAVTRSTVADNERTPDVPGGARCSPTCSSPNRRSIWRSRT